MNFYNSEKTGGLILVFVTLISLTLANSSFEKEYIGFWHTNIGGHDLVHWINEGLMTVFFLLIGLELEREFYRGELSEFKNAISSCHRCSWRDGSTSRIVYPSQCRDRI